MKTKEAYNVLFVDYPDIVNVEQMCEMLGGISTKTAYQLLKTGSIKSFIVGKRYVESKVASAEAIVELLPAAGLPEDRKTAANQN